MQIIIYTNQEIKKMTEIHSKAAKTKQNQKPDNCQERYRKSIRFEIIKKFVWHRFTQCQLNDLNKCTNQTAQVKLQLSSTKNFQFPFDRACAGIQEIMHKRHYEFPASVHYFFGQPSQIHPVVEKLIRKSYKDPQLIQLSIERGVKLIQRMMDIFSANLTSKSQIKQAVSNFVKNGKSKQDSQQNKCIQKLTKIIYGYFNSFEPNQQSQVKRMEQNHKLEQIQQKIKSQKQTNHGQQVFENHLKNCQVLEIPRFSSTDYNRPKYERQMVEPEDFFTMLLHQSENLDDLLYY